MIGFGIALAVVLGLLVASAYWSNWQQAKRSRNRQKIIAGTYEPEPKSDRDVEHYAHIGVLDAEDWLRRIARRPRKEDL